MKFIEKLYLGETVKKKPEKLIRRIRQKKFLLDTYVICLPEGPEDPLEYFNARELNKSYYDRHEPVIIGLAKGEEEAIGIVNRIVKDCIRETGSINLRSYVLSLTESAGAPC